MKKGMFVGLVFLGVVSAIFAVLGPIHEIWHWIAAVLSGVDADIGWTVTYISIPDVTLFIGYAGVFGEITSLTLIFLWLMYKKHFKLASWIFGYSLSYIIIITVMALDIFVPLDLVVMLENYSKTTVYSIWYIFVFYYGLATAVQILTLAHYKSEIFERKTSNYAKKVAKNIKHIQNGGVIGEKLYKPLTLVE